MATRASKPTTTEAPAIGGSFLGGGGGGSLLGSKQLRLTPGLGPSTWMISAAKLGCRHGRIVPLVVPAWHAPGISGNIRGDAGAGFIRALMADGFVEIPHHREAVAFGKKRPVAPPSTYLQRLVGVDAVGRPAVQWVDAWRRPEQLGHLVMWDDDRDGRDEFLVKALLELANNGKPLSDIQIKLATEPVIRRIQDEARRETPRAKMLILEMAGHLPDKHTPDVIREMVERIRPARKDATPEK